jgi:hypothetical protein
VRIRAAAPIPVLLDFVRLDFPLPLTVQPGIFPLTLASNATETCASDPTKTLSASSSMDVQVEVKPNPNVPP